MLAPVKLKRLVRDLYAEWPIPLRSRKCRRSAIESLEVHSTEPDVIPVLLEATVHKDAYVAGRAQQALKNLATQDAKELLYSLAIEDPDGPAGRLCIETGGRPSDEERSLLFLFVTRQFDEYFKVDSDLTRLTKLYTDSHGLIRGNILTGLRHLGSKAEAFYKAHPDLFHLNEKDKTLLALIPGGAFSPESSELAATSITVPSFHMAVYPITNAQYKRFLDETGHHVPEAPDFGAPVWKGKEFREELANHPMVCVSWDDAQAYCNWAGLRLPSELEWEWAARGPEGWQYPWGDEWHPENCRNKMNGAEKQTCEVWDYPEGCSHWGIFQMAGNVWEWCQDDYEETAEENGVKKNASADADERAKILRGGSWDEASPICFKSTCRCWNDASRTSNRRGFRCVSSRKAL